MKRMLALLATLLLAGCMGMQTAYEKMSADQIQALAKMKDANVACVIANTPWGRGVSVFANVDRGVIQRGVLTVDGECKVTVSNDSPAPTLQPSGILAPLPPRQPVTPTPPASLPATQATPTK